MATVFKRGKTWVVEWHDLKRAKHRWAGFPDRGLTEKLAHRIERLVTLRTMTEPIGELADWVKSLPRAQQAALTKLGLVSGEDFYVAQPIETYLERWRAWKQAHDEHPRHILNSVSQVRKLLDGIGATRLDRINPDRVVEWLAELRAPDEDGNPGRSATRPASVDR